MFLKKIIQTIFINGLSFVTSLPDWIEFCTYILALVTIFTVDVELKFAFGSVAILLSYIVFSFLIQKVKVIGLYVMAFKRTMVNSAKFLPIFAVIWAGFVLSFRMRAQFGVDYFNSTSNSLTLFRYLLFTCLINIYI